MKKILHVLAQYPGKTGSGIYLESIMAQCNKKGYSQALIAGISIEDDIEFKYADKSYPVIFNSQTIPFPILGMSDNMPYESTKYSSMDEEMMIKWEDEFKRVLINAIEDFKPSVIISHHLWLSTSFVREIASDIKVIGVCHGTDLRQFNKLPRYRAKVLSGCENLDLVFSLNTEQKFLINKAYNIPNNKIIVVGGGYNEEIFYFPSYKRMDREVRLVYAGKLSYAKGLIPLLNVFNILKDKYNVKLFLAGTATGEEERAIKRLGKEIGKSVIFLGGLKQSELAEVFRNSDIFILPSFYEGLPLVIIESLASGLRVVSTEIDGLKSYLSDKINDSNIIEYVKLPKMAEVDKPLSGEMDGFQNRLKEKIEKQIKNIINEYPVEANLETEINRLSWGGVFAKMDKHL